MKLAAGPDNSLAHRSRLHQQRTLSSCGQDESLVIDYLQGTEHLNSEFTGNWLQSLSSAQIIHYVYGHQCRYLEVCVIVACKQFALFLNQMLH